MTLSVGNETAAVQSVLAMDESQTEVASAFKSKIQEEVVDVCRPAGQSSLRRSSIADIVDFDLKEQELEIQQIAPTFVSMHS